MDTGDALPDTLWLALTRDEARRLIDELTAWLKDGPPHPQYNIGIVDPTGDTLLVEVVESDDPRFASRFAKPS
jgi:hypothetical protein